MQTICTFYANNLHIKFSQEGLKDREDYLLSINDHWVCSNHTDMNREFCAVPVPGHLAKKEGADLRENLNICAQGVGKRTLDFMAVLYQHKEW